jgi:RNA polymerase-associated protein
MVATTGRKPIMTLFSGGYCLQSHICRVVLFEKEVEYHNEQIESSATPNEMAEFNPYNETPTLVDRSLVLYGTQIICEYLDERLPHPPLMPVDPVNRGRARLMILRIQRDWLEAVGSVDLANNKKLDSAAKQSIRDGLISISPVFAEQTHMLGNEFSIVDCFMGPLLWRLPILKVTLPKQAAPALKYAERLFARPAFIASLSEAENEMRG